MRFSDLAVNDLYEDSADGYVWRKIGPDSAVLSLKRLVIPLLESVEHTDKNELNLVSYESAPAPGEPWVIPPVLCEKCSLPIVKVTRQSNFRRRR